MNTHIWQGFPPTTQRGNEIEITLRWRSPRRIRLRPVLFKVGVIASIGFMVFGLFFGELSHLDPLLLAAMFATWLAVLLAGLTAWTWRKRILVYSPEWISFQYRLDHKRLQRSLPHGYRLQGFHVPQIGQPPQQAPHVPFVHQNFFLFLDHPEQTVLLAEVSGAHMAEMLLKRLVNVSEYMKQRYAHRQGGEHQGEESPRGTFHRRVAI